MKSKPSLVGMVVVECDECGATRQFSQDDVERGMRNIGWKSLWGKDFCDDCLEDMEREGELE